MATRTSLRVALLAASLALAACDDGDSPSEEDTLDTAPADTSADTSPDTAPDTLEDTAPDSAEPDLAPDGSDTCDPDLCLAMGQVCVPGSVACVDPPPCTADGDPCDLDGAFVDDFLCIDGPGDGLGTCRAACATDEDCPEDSACIDGPEGSWCQADECAFFFENDCAAGRCVPVAKDIDLCVADEGTRIEHAPCAWHTDCASSGICIEGRCAVPQCSYRENDRVDCADESLRCDTFLVDGAPLEVGTCRSYCSPWEAETGCAVDAWCRPLFELDGGAFGVCMPDIGVGEADAACEGTLDCDRGLVCSRGLCKEVCEPGATSGPTTCADATRECVRFFGGMPFGADWGLCLEPCEPFAAEPGCGEDEWCAVATQLDGGFCQATAGRVEEAGRCLGLTPADTCQDGLICLETLDCRTACAPGAAPGSPGDTCAEGSACALLSDAQGDPLSVGYCAPTCDYHGGVGCTDAVRSTCAMGEGFFQTFDLCLPPPRQVLEPDASCAAAGLYEFELCAEGGAVCLPRPGDGALVCKDFCAVSEGPFEMVGHPDCRNPAQRCSAVFGADAALGLCL